MSAPTTADVIAELERPHRENFQRWQEQLAPMAEALTTVLEEMFYAEKLGERCEWSDLPANTCAHCIYGPAAYTDFPTMEELW